MQTHTDNLHKISHVNDRIKRQLKEEKNVKLLEQHVFRTLQGKHYFLDCSFSWHTHFTYAILCYGLTGPCHPILCSSSIEISLFVFWHLKRILLKKSYGYIYGMLLQQ